MVNKIRFFGKGIKNIVDDTLQTYKDILSSAQNRLVIGLILVGLGAGLIASAFIRVM